MPSITPVFRRIALALILVTTANTFDYAAAQTPSAPMDHLTLLTRLTARGRGKRIKITELDGSIVKGMIVSIDRDSFQMEPKQSLQPIRIQYSQVAALRNDGLSTGAKVGIGIGVGAVVFAGYILVTCAASGCN